MTSEIQPFRIEIPPAGVDYLHDRPDSARSPGELPGTGWERGVSLGYLTELAGYWRTGFDWRAADAQLNSCQHFPAMEAPAQLAADLRALFGPLQ